MGIGYSSDLPWAFRAKSERARWFAYFNVKDLVAAYQAAGVESAGIGLEEFETFTHEQQNSVRTYHQNEQNLARIGCTLAEWMAYSPEYQKTKLKFASDAISKGMT